MRLRLYATALSASVIVVACLVVTGWILEIDALKSILPGFASMKFNTALGFIFMSLSFLAFLRAHPPLFSCSLLVLIIALSTLTLIQDAFNMDFGIDEALIVDNDTLLEDNPGRMSTASAIGFVIFSISLTLLYTRRIKAAQFAAIAGNSFMTIPLLGYLFNVDGLPDATIFGAIPLMSATLFVTFGTAILLSEPESEFLQVIQHKGAAGQVLRRSIPFAFVVPILFGLLTTIAESANLFNYVIGQAILVQMLVLSRLYTMWRNTRTVIHKQAVQDTLEDEARMSLEKFLNVFRESTDVILIVSERDGSIIDVNHASMLYLGIPPENLRGKHFHTLFKDSIEPGFIENLQFSREFMLEQPVRRVDGTFCPMDLTAKIIPWENGRAVLVTLRDVSERKRFQEELMLAQLKQIEIEKEHELVKMKESFIAEISHDFKTPLSVISLSSDILHRYYDRLNLDQTLTHLERIRFQAHFMKEMIDDVMTYVEAHQGGILTQKATTNIVDLCTNVISDLEYQFPRREINFKVNSPIINLLLDPRLMRRAVNNLLTNALKYSPEDQPVFLRVTREDQTIIIEVEDHGIGIPVEDHDRLFKAFQRASNVREIKGTGLGLVIVKDCVAVHDGTIAFTSQVGKGTTFTLRIPIVNGQSKITNIHTA